MKQLVFISLCAVTALFSAQPSMPVFSDFDLNKDGKIMQSEFEQAQAQRMQKMAELGKQMRNAANAPMFSDIDKNGDGVISELEFANHQQEDMQKRSNNKMSSGMGMGAGKN